MAKGIYVSAATPGSGESLIAWAWRTPSTGTRTGSASSSPWSTATTPTRTPMVAVMKARFDLGDERCRGGLTFAEAAAAVVAHASVAP